MTMKYHSRPLGEIFPYKKTFLKVVDDVSCDNCYFFDKSKECTKNVCVVGSCCCALRPDAISVIFVELKPIEL